MSLYHAFLSGGMCRIVFLPYYCGTNFALPSIWITSPSFNVNASPSDLRFLLASDLPEFPIEILPVPVTVYVPGAMSLPTLYLPDDHVIIFFVWEDTEDSSPASVLCFFLTSSRRVSFSFCSASLLSDILSRLSCDLLNSSSSFCFSVSREFSVSVSRMTVLLISFVSIYVLSVSRSAARRFETALSLFGR